MAARALSLIAGLSVAGLVIGPVMAVLWRAETFSGFGPADWQALRFTLMQALVSAALSVLVAVPVARALARRRFRGRGVLVALMGAPFILPVIVAVLGLLAVFGQSGLLNRTLGPLGVPRMDIYGLHGVVLAHVFFNLPLATRLILQAWLAVPNEHFRLAAMLGLGRWAMWRAIEWPLLRRIVPGAFAVIFVICLSSFAVALTLGGGPRATTLELAIYQSVRFDFDLARAAALGLLQLVIALAAGLVALRVAAVPVAARGLDRAVPRWDGQAIGARIADMVWIALASLFLLTPLAMVALNGVAGITTLSASVWQSAGHSVLVALGSTALCLLWALPLSTRWGEWLGLSGIALSPLVLGIGLFLIVRPFINPFEVALYVTATVNAFVSLPFVLRILRPEAEIIRIDYARLRGALGLSGWAWLRWVLLPRLKRPLGFAAGLTAALSMGDLGVIALFADPDRATLPLKVYQLMGSYRMDQAAGAALLLLLLSLGLFWLFDRGGRVGSAS
ncbi:thiamine/thiamine pyrophosphate ABC transporter permease ThiP [Marivita sp. S2033]|uniref:thiamine/thiamine pyrophosphate ABC transporter permease ThiP n=1 Tax=Marivita sp. S2033 TaxID=3373187 RepID=UPI003981B4B5